MDNSNVISSMVPKVQPTVIIIDRKASLSKIDIRTIPHHENSWKYVEEYTFHPVWHVMGGRCPKKYRHIKISSQ